eukprot:6201002-Pleurochrysis_carterae.AAC.2
MGSKMHPDNETESHLNSSFSSAAVSSRLASYSASFLRFFIRYLNHSNKSTDILLAPFTFPLPFRVKAACKRFSVLSQACGTR